MFSTQFTASRIRIALLAHLPQEQMSGGLLMIAVRLQRLRWIAIVVAGIVASLAASSTHAEDSSGSATALKAVILQDPNFFPIAVWLQNPNNAARYKAAGINLYVGLWRGPTEEQLATLKQYGMYVICAQNAAGLAHKEDPTII